MIFDIVKFKSTGNEYLISAEKSQVEVFRILDGALMQSTNMDYEKIEYSLESCTATVIGRAKVSIEISLI